MATRGETIRGAGGNLQRSGEGGVGIGPPYGGDEGEIRVQMVDNVPRLYARAGGEWWNTRLTQNTETGHIASEALRVDHEGTTVLAIEQTAGLMDLYGTAPLRIKYKAKEGVTVGTNAPSTYAASIIIGDGIAHDITTVGVSNILIGQDGMYGGFTEKNVALGYDVGLSNSYGDNADTLSRNVLIGNSVLKWNGGYITDNILIGSTIVRRQEGHSNTGGFNNNIFMGKECGSYVGVMWGDNPYVLGGGTVRYNIAMGFRALDCKHPGEGNIVIGEQACGVLWQEDRSPGDKNIFMGYRSGGYAYFGGHSGGSRIDGCKENVCIGVMSGGQLEATADDEAWRNVFIGYTCGSRCTTGNSNLAIGDDSGDTITTGDYNICIGSEADGAATLNEQIAIGMALECDTAETLRIGNATNYLLYDFSAGGEVSITSDERVKKNIVNTDIGLEFINALRPIKYTPKDKHEYPGELFQDGVNPLKEGDKQSVGSKRIEGFIAQEVKQVMDDLGVTFSGWHQNNSSRQMLGYSTFVVPLVKAVQELSAKVTALEAQIN